MSLKLGSFAVLGVAILWIALGQVKAEDLSQTKYPSSLERW